ncbi:MAG: TetR/AcrR family transcriptional regulator [Bacteroidota bacterium]|nr:TetR/AcrR family transcriptional regulator [Bacteroidota bacterium]
MSPRTKEQYDDIRESKKKLILDSALDLFANQGFHATSISSIAKKAKISKGLLYNYFESKEKLLMEIMNSGIQEFIDYFDTNEDGILSDSEFKYFIEMSLLTLKSRTNYWKLYFALALQPTVFSILKKKYRKLIESTLAIMEEYFKNKGYKNPKMQALMFGAFMDGISLNYVMDPENFQLEEIKDYVIKSYLNLNDDEN